MQVDSSRPESPMKPLGSSWRARLPFFYGWVVVASVFLFLAITYGIHYSFSVFFVALLEEFGWNRGVTASVFSVYVLILSSSGAIAGTLIDRFGPRRVVPAGAVLLSAGLVATSRVTELWQFYLFFGLACGLGIALAGWVPCGTLMSRWFSARRGVAMGIATAGIGLGTVAMVPLSQHLISNFGWRSAYVVLAAVVLVGIVPQAAFLLVGRPDEIGSVPDGDLRPRAQPMPAKPLPKRKWEVVDLGWASRAWSVATAIRTSRFWLLTGNFAFGVLTIQMLWVHQAAYLVDGGFDRLLVASALGLSGLVSMPGKLLWGMVGDRFGREITYTLGATIMVAAIALLILTRFFPIVELMFIFSIVFAVGYAVTGPVSPVAAADIFGGKNFGTIYGVMCISNGVGSAFGAWLAGYVFDVTGSYFVAFGTAMASSSLSALCLWLAAPRKVRRAVRQQATDNRQQA